MKMPVMLTFALVTASTLQALDLPAAQQLAAAADPRVAQLQLEAEQSRLRLENIAAERRPSLVVQAQAQHQSEVVQIPISIPGHAAPEAPKDTLDATLSADQLLLDPTRQARIDAERARLAEAEARVKTALYGLRQEVIESFFAAAVLQEREAQIATSMTDLEARLREANLRIENGTALPSEAASIEAVLLERREDAAELRAKRAAALARLSKLTGQPVSKSESLTIPSLAAEFEQVRSRIDTIRERPEFAQFAAARGRLESQKQLTNAQLQPRLSAYGRLGYGKPGLDFLSDTFHPYWLAGVRLQWKPWDWGASERDRSIAALQQQAIDADEAAFARTLGRSVQNDIANVDRLLEAVNTDDRIVALRELIERETGARYDEHVVTSADYVDKETDVLEARIRRATHRAELSQARARVLNILGVEIH